MGEWRDSELLQTVACDPGQISGVFRLILYSGSFSPSMGRIAFLDSDDEVMLEPYAPAFDFRIIPRLAAQEAIRQAEAFITNNARVLYAAYGKVMDKRGRIVAYEVRPIYESSAFGTDQLLAITYWKRKGSVSIHIDPHPEALDLLT